MKRLIWAAVLLFFFFYALPVSASGIIIGTGGTIKLNGQTISMNCNDLTVEGGGNLNLGQGLIENCRHFTLEKGATFVDGSGDMTLCGTWENNSSFQKSATSTIDFVTGCAVQNRVKGTGDTDGDGVADRLESFHDANDDGLPDFLDSTLTAVYWVSPAAIQMLLLLENDK
jgi:hypothetical protein